MEHHNNKRPFHYGWVILLTGVLVVAGALGLARFGYGMILPSMQENLGLTHDQAGLIAAANMFGYFISALVAGLLAAKYGPRLVVGLALVWTGLTMLLTGFLHSAEMVALARFLTGTGSAGANIAVMGLASAWFAPRRRGMATGLLVGGSGLAIAFTGLVIPSVNETFQADGWRYSWFFLGGIVVAIGVGAGLLLRNQPSEKSLQPIGESAVATVGAGAAPEPAGMGHLLRIRGVIPLAALYFCFGFSYVIATTFLVTFLVDEVNCTQEMAGRIWSVIGVLSIGSGLVWGIISDRLGRPPVLAVVFLLQACCYLLLLSKLPGLLLWLPAVLFGLTAFSIPGLAASCCGDLGGARRAPAVLGLITFVFGFGQVLGPIFAGYIKEYTASFAGAFLLAALLALLGAFLSTKLKMTRETEGHRDGKMPA